MDSEVTVPRVEDYARVLWARLGASCRRLEDEHQDQAIEQEVNTPTVSPVIDLNEATLASATMS